MFGNHYLAKSVTLLLAVAVSVVYTQTTDTCIIANSCVREAGQEKDSCPDPSNINTPTVAPYAPFTN